MDEQARVGGWVCGWLGMAQSDLRDGELKKWSEVVEHRVCTQETDVRIQEAQISDTHGQKEQQSLDSLDSGTGLSLPLKGLVCGACVQTRQNQASGRLVEPKHVVKPDATHNY
ncbi:hypothetical protein Tco_0455559 [Tanacetum coccineum]